ncbi:DUF1127 domain-containing protein [Mesorhizobium sp. LHD-90]|uniref:DUF1127 domain-containing protein n=1 Tax=Mesorhizobium sp. LHD-90 TaxID=3071414 RepID=UPI0027E12ABB|nr:DUF1127 domain-containing protein [Mesorhizobium sp. LHD-90]MDQ6433112.1 DUF1127 domain-containing protein [Mesorhizobium sp. LHD-90]
MSAMKTLSTSGSYPSTSPAAGFGTRALRLVSGAIEGLSAMFERRRGRLALLEMTDDQLKDIGFSRADAEREGLRRPWQ